MNNTEFVKSGYLSLILSLFVPEAVFKLNHIRYGTYYSKAIIAAYVNNACDITLSVYPHRASLKNMPDHGGNRTYDLWNTCPMLCKLSYAVWSDRVRDISEQNLVPSISMLSINNHDFSVLM